MLLETTFYMLLTELKLMPVKLSLPVVTSFTTTSPSRDPVSNPKDHLLMLADLKKMKRLLLKKLKTLFGMLWLADRGSLQLTVRAKLLCKNLTVCSISRFSQWTLCSMPIHWNLQSTLRLSLILTLLKDPGKQTPNHLSQDQAKFSQLKNLTRDLSLVTTTLFLSRTENGSTWEWELRASQDLSTMSGDLWNPSGSCLTPLLTSLQEQQCWLLSLLSE